MFPIWLILGMVLILMGIFHRQMMRLLGLRPLSEVMTATNLKRASKRIEQIGRGLVITLGVSFFVFGLGAILPHNLSRNISCWLLGLSGFMLLALLVISIANWRVK